MKYTLSFLFAAATCATATLCSTGECSTEMGTSATIIHGPKDAIGDLTAEAGWFIVGCNPDQAQQKILALCLKEGTCGDVPKANALARLPPDCAPEGFAHIAEITPKTLFTLTDDEVNQIPPKLTRHKAFYVIKFDVNYSKVDNSSADTVFVFTAVGQPKDTPKLNRRQRFPGGKNRKTKLVAVMQKPEVDTTLIDQEFTFPVQTSFKDAPIIGFKGECVEEASKHKLGDKIVKTHGGGGIGFQVTASADVDLQLATGVAMSGTLVPPSVDEIQLYAKITGKITGTIRIRGSGHLRLDSDDVLVLQVPIVIPEIPKIASFGPKFQIFVRGDVVAQANVDAEIGFGYQFNDLRVFWPESQKNKNSGSFTPIETAQGLSLGEGKSELSSTLHFMPRLAFNIEVLGAHGAVFAEVDFSGTAGISLEPAHGIWKDYLKPIIEHTPTVYIMEKELQLFKGSKPAVIEREGSSSALDQLGIKGCYYVRFKAGLNVGATAGFFTLFKLAIAAKISLYETPTWEPVMECSGKARVPEPEPLRVSKNLENADAREKEVMTRRSVPRSSLERRASDKGSFCRLSPQGVIKTVIKTMPKKA